MARERPPLPTLIVAVGLALKQARTASLDDAGSGLRLIDNFDNVEE
jgi:hypothetical protein